MEETNRDLSWEGVDVCIAGNLELKSHRAFSFRRDGGWQYYGLVFEETAATHFKKGILQEAGLPRILDLDFQRKGFPEADGLPQLPEAKDDVGAVHCVAALIPRKTDVPLAEDSL